MARYTRRSFLHHATVAGAGLSGAIVAKGGDAPVPAARFRLGLVTYNIAANWDLPTILQVCRTVGLSPVELRTTHRHGVEPSLGKSERKEVRRRFHDADIEFWGSGTVCEFESPDAAVVRRNIDTCKRFIDLVADLGGHGVKVRPNGLPREVPVAKTLAQIGHALVPCAKAAADRGLEIWVEVHGYGTQKPAHMKTIMENCGQTNVGLTWNSNPTDVHKGSVADAFRLLRPWIRSCHINELYKDAQGAYPYRELFTLMRRTGYDRVTLIELGRGMPDVASGQELLRYYKALWNELIGRHAA